MAQSLGQRVDPTQAMMYIASLAMMHMRPTGDFMPPTMPLLPDHLALRDLRKPATLEPAPGSPAQGTTPAAPWSPAEESQSDAKEECADKPADADAQMRAALAGRTARRTNKGKGAKKPKGKPTEKKKTPKAKGVVKKGKGGLRKSCEATKYTKPVTFPWTIDDKKRNRNTFVSSWYYRQRKLLLNSGSAAAPMKKELSRVCRLAGTIWDKHH